MQRFILITLSSIIFFTGCTAIKSTVHTIGRSLGAVFRSPDTLKNRIENPVVPEAELAVLWVGHATCLVQIDDKFILTDPNFTPTVGQFSKRLIEPGIDPQHLPQLDAVVISHLHIDHLSPKSLELIETKVGQLLVPEQGLVYIPNFDFAMQEIKMWHTWEEDDLKITLVPAIHNGWRYGLEHAWMKKSFGGYVIEYKGITVYFAGDTAYDDSLYRNISKKFGQIDLALIPVAPIHPREYSKARHTDPREAVQMMLDMDAQFLIPIHYDTYPESIDVPGEAVDSMYAAIKHFAVPDERVAILDIGDQKVLIEKDNTAQENSVEKKMSGAK